MDEEKILRDTETGEEFTYEEIEAEYERLKHTETGEEFTYEEIEAEYERLKLDGETEAKTIGDYIENITEPNGTYEWIDEIWYKCEWCGEIFPIMETLFRRNIF